MIVLGMLGQMKSFFVESFWLKGQEYGKKVALACAEFVHARCSAEDLRIAQKKDIMFFASNVESILDAISVTMSTNEKVEAVYKVSETIELEIALKCLKMPVLEKKLIGHSVLIAQICKVRSGNR
jgi:hypothetical protein